MQFFLSALVAFGLALVGMAIGVLFGRSCIRGTCGGSGAHLDGSTPGGCEHCPSRMGQTDHRSRKAGEPGEPKSRSDARFGGCHR